MKTIEIIDPIENKGRNRKFIVDADPHNDDSFVYLGAVVRDENGSALRNATVNITATDETQNKIIESTGNQKKAVIDGAKVILPFYPYTYQFRTAGKHTITFECEGVTELVELSAEDTLN